MRTLGDDEKGIAGFFEDLPTLLIVLVATTLFLSTMLNTVMTYRDYKETQYIREDLNQFIEEIRNWNYLVLEERGQFAGDRVSSLDADRMKKEFNTTALGYNYRVFIEDRSDYPRQFDKTIHTEEIPDEVEIYSRSSFVTVVDERGNEHLCEMVVSIWAI